MSLFHGVGFHPSDEELVTNYLKRKVERLPIATLPNGAAIIPELDLYKHEPWDLQENSSLTAESETELYFFTPLERKCVNSMHTYRATEAGYWRATGKDTEIKEKGRIVGMKKTLVFYRGKPPVGERTNFVIHEYQLHKQIDVSQNFVVCKLMNKSGTVSKRAPKVAPIDRIPISARSYYTGGKASGNPELWYVPSVSDVTFVSETLEDEEDSSLTNRRFKLETVEDEENSSEPAGASDMEAETPTEVQSKVQEIQQKEEDEFWSKYFTNGEIESALKEIQRSM